VAKTATVWLILNLLAKKTPRLILAEREKDRKGGNGVVFAFLNSEPGHDAARPKKTNCVELHTSEGGKGEKGGSERSLFALAKRPG